MRKEPLCNHQWGAGRCLMCRWKPQPDYWRQHDRNDGSKRQWDVVRSERQKDSPPAAQTGIHGSEDSALDCRENKPATP